jgi:hypothetical protein
MVKILIDVTANSHSYEMLGPMTMAETLRLYYALDYMKADITKAIDDSSATVSVPRGN